MSVLQVAKNVIINVETVQPFTQIAFLVFLVRIESYLVLFVHAQTDTMTMGLLKIVFPAIIPVKNAQMGQNALNAMRLLIDSQWVINANACQHSTTQVFRTVVVAKVLAMNALTFWSARHVSLGLTDNSQRSRAPARLGTLTPVLKSVPSATSSVWNVTKQLIGAQTATPYSIIVN